MKHTKLRDNFRYNKHPFIVYFLSYLIRFVITFAAVLNELLGGLIIFVLACVTLLIYKYCSLYNHRYYTKKCLVLSSYLLKDIVYSYPILNYRPTMIGIEPTLGIGASKEVELFVLLSPVGTYYSR